MQVASAARSWERLGAPQTISWFPASHNPVAVASPAPGTQISPASPLRLTFSKPVSDVLGKRRPRLSPAAAGHWSVTDPHTIVFTPSGFGVGFGTHLRVESPPRRGGWRDAGPRRVRGQVEWTVPPGSTAAAAASSSPRPATCR